MALMDLVARLIASRAGLKQKLAQAQADLFSLQAAFDAYRASEDQEDAVQNAELEGVQTALAAALNTISIDSEEDAAIEAAVEAALADEGIAEPPVEPPTEPTAEAPAGVF